MSPDQERRLEEIFSAARKLPPQKRAAFLEQACGGDAELRRQADSLLAAHDQAGDFLDHTIPLPASDFLIERTGTMIGRYKLLQKIGEGGFGVVYMAEQVEPVQRKVALKIIKAGMDTREVIARFEAERQALALMDHPGIANILDAGATEAGRPYFVMELVNGMPITDYCDRKKLPTAARLHLFMKVCHAVQHAHQKGIIHRDLKPTNVLVTLHDGEPVPKVIDFGVVKALGQKLTQKTLFTGFQHLVGTPAYMSPEQAELSGLDVDTRSDIYSLGVLLYELLTSLTPFDKATLAKAAFDEMRRMIRETEPPKPSTRLNTLSQDELGTVAAKRQAEPTKLNRLVRGDLDWIVMKCLEKDRRRRYETANDLASDIERHLNQEPVTAAAPSTVYQAQKFIGRHKAGLAVVGLALLILVLLGAGAGWVVRDREARREENAQQVRQSLSRARNWIGENKLALARQELAAAKARVGIDRGTMGGLAKDIEVLETEIGRYERFLDLVEQAHEAEFPQPMVLVVRTDAPEGGAVASPQASSPVREPAKAVPFLLQAMSCYGILERDDWTARLKGGSLAPDQIAQVRRTAHQELLWLADDIARREVDHRSGLKMSHEDAAEKGLAYLNRAENAARSTSAFYQIRARLLKAAGKEAEASQADDLARRTPATIALDHYLLAGAAYDARDMAGALRQYEAALRLEPTHYWSLLGVGLCLSSKDRPEQDFALAATAFTGCILHRPDQVRPYCGRGYVYGRLKRFAEAEADLRQAIRLDPDYLYAHSHLGFILNEQGKCADAEAEYRAVIRLQPDFPHGHCGLGHALCGQGKYVEAEREFREEARLHPHPDFYCAPHWVVIAMSAQEKYAVAAQYYVEKAAADPKFAESFDLMNRHNAACQAALAGCGKGDGAKLDDVERARLRRQAHDWLRANLLAWGRILEKQPEQARAHLERPCAWLQDHDYDGVRGNALTKLPEAEEKAWRQLWADADQFVARVKSPYGAWSSPELKRRLDDLSALLRSNPREAGLLEQRAGLYAYLGRYDEAALDFIRAREVLAVSSGVNPSSIMSESMMQYEEVFTRIIELRPDDLALLRERSHYHAMRRQWKPALAMADKAIELTRHHANLAAQEADLWNERGKLLGNAGQAENAFDAFTTAIELASANTNACTLTLRGALLSRSVLLMRMNRLAEAATDRSKAFDIFARDPRANANPVDLSLFYNGGLKENTHGDVPENNLAALPTGIQTLGGTKFDIQGLIQVSRSLPACPPLVTNIPVGQVCHSFHFLHAAFGAFGIPDGTQIGRYLVRYSNGQQREIPIIAGQDVADWWEQPNEQGKPLVVAWTGTNGKSERTKCRVRLFKTTWPNPRPELEVQFIDFEALDKKAIPFVVAITAE
jgi:serine/threonine protein kinase/Flp pilus assembly protein TadD